jgi:hypothetical protein
MRKKSLFFFLGVCVFAIHGCTTDTSLSYQRIRRSMVFVERSDGISEAEAGIIAQNLIINKGLADRLYGLKPIGFEKQEIWTQNGEVVEFAIHPKDPRGYEIKRRWLVLFRDKEGSLLLGAYPVIPFCVEIDANTGIVEGWGLKP